jgi:hypothetical protein
MEVREREKNGAPALELHARSTYEWRYPNVKGLGGFFCFFVLITLYNMHGDNR